MNKKISFEIDNEDIDFADLTNRESLELVIICRSGNIFIFDLEKNQKTFLTKLTFEFPLSDLMTVENAFKILRELSPTELSDLVNEELTKSESIESIAEKKQDFINDLSLNAKLYSFENYFCIVQQKGILGIVLDISNAGYQKKLTRGDYFVEQCEFPIAFYKKENRTFLIHGTDWNRLDITYLETDELLTDRSVDYETNSNYFDYFHSSLLVSPDAKHFTSNGWHWHPFGQIYYSSIESFLQKFELSNKRVDVSDENFYDLDWDRPLCWIDNQTLAVGFNQQVCHEKQGSYPSEILFFDISRNEIIKRINFDGFGLTYEGNVYGELFYNAENKQFVSLNKKSGLLISDINGTEVYRDSSLTSHKYSPHHKLLYKIDIKNQTVEFEKL